MKSNPNWVYNEMKQVGVDYTDISEVSAYDERMQSLRNIEEEVQDILNFIGINEEHVVIEIGTGTGELAISMAKYCQKIIALDVSKTMLEYAREKAGKLGINHIEFINAGFLNYAGKPVDVIISQIALHHLPDFWKLIALKRIYRLLKPGGRLYLRDVVYSFDCDKHEPFFNKWINEIKNAAGDEMARDTARSIAEEYCTIDWIMEGLIKQAGFSIQAAEYINGFLAIYKCNR